MLALIALIFLPYLFWQSWKSQQLSKASTAWPTAPGTITESGTTKIGWRLQPRVAYTYVVDGIAYTGNQISFAKVVPARETQPVLSLYPIGKSVVVAHAPGAPGMAILETGANRHLSYSMRYFAAIFLLLIALQVVNYYLPKFTAEKNPEPAHRVYGDPGTVDPAAVNRSIRDDAEHGKAREQFTVGTWYLLGQEGMQKDAAEAAKWYRKSAEQGYVDSEVALAELYASGRGVTKDAANTLLWLNKAAAQNDPRSFYYLGMASERGFGVPKDNAKALDWYQKAKADPRSAAAIQRVTAAMKQ